MVHYSCRSKCRFVHQNFKRELCPNVHMLQTEYSALFWLSVCVMVTYSFCFSLFHIPLFTPGPRLVWHKAGVQQITEGCINYLFEHLLYWRHLARHTGESEDEFWTLLASKSLVGTFKLYLLLTIQYVVESAKNHNIVRVSQEWLFGGGGICAGFSGRRKAEAERLESIGRFFNHS